MFDTALSAGSLGALYDSNEPRLRRGSPVREDSSDDGCVVIDPRNLGLDKISHTKATLLFT